MCNAYKHVLFYFGRKIGAQAWPLAQTFLDPWPLQGSTGTRVFFFVSVVEHGAEQIRTGVSKSKFT